MAAEIEVVRPESDSLMRVIGNLAANPNVDPDKISRLLEIQERWEMNRAKAEFREAMADFKKEPPEIFKNKKVAFGQTAYTHATLDNVTDAITEALSKVGITHRFTMKQDQSIITVNCILSRGIYSEETFLCAGADTSGAKNAVQAIGSTVTYLQRYTLLAATGLATADQDNDGAGTPNPRLEAALKEIRAAADPGQLKDSFEKWYKEFKAAKDGRATKAVIDCKDEEKRKFPA